MRAFAGRFILPHMGEPLLPEPFLGCPIPSSGHYPRRILPCCTAWCHLTLGFLTHRVPMVVLGWSWDDCPQAAKLGSVPVVLAWAPS